MSVTRILTLFILCAMLIPSVAQGQMTTFGYTTKGTNGVQAIENILAGYGSASTGGTPTLPSASGDVDSMTFCIRFTTTSQPQNIKLRCAIYEYTAQGMFGVATPSLVDSCARETTYVCNNATETTWVSFPAAIGYTVSPSVYCYVPMVWAQASASWVASLVYGTVTNDTGMTMSRNYANSLPDPLTPGGYQTPRAYSAYVTYTIPSTGNRRTRYYKQSLWKEAQETFAGDYNVIQN